MAKNQRAKVGRKSVPQSSQPNESQPDETADSSVEKKQQELRFEPFRFRNFLGLSPQIYVPAIYGILLLTLLYWLFLDSGLRHPKVRLQFYTLSGDASLYVNGKFHSNQLFSPKQYERTVLLPAGEMELRVEKAGMETWVLRRNFPAKVWNNRWAPTIYTLPIQMTKAKQAGTAYFWQEAWRAYLYRGLEGQKAVSFDASHPYPWGLSEGLRAYFYSKNSEVSPAGQGIATRPVHWSADIQKGLASTTNIYQWGDLLSAYSLAVQFVPERAAPKQVKQVNQTGQGSGRSEAEQGHLEVLGPRSLAALVRSAVKRLKRLEPGVASLRGAWDKGLNEELAQVQNQNLANFWAGARPRQRQQGGETASTESSAGTIALSFGDFRFVQVPGADFAVQQQLVSKGQFVRFWFSDFGQDWRKQRVRNLEAVGSLPQSVLYPADQLQEPWDWPPDSSASLEQLRASPLYGPLWQDQPVRGITWSEAQAFVTWLQQEEPQSDWQLALPDRAEYELLAQEVAALQEAEANWTEPELDFEIPSQPPAFSQQAAGALGIQGLGGTLWQWLADDYLPYVQSPSRAGSSDLAYKAVAGGSWLNALPIDKNTEDLWTDEFLQEDNELPVRADFRTIGGQFAEIRSPYTGFRLIARKRLSSSRNWDF